MPAPAATAAAGAVLKQAAWAVARRRSRSVLGRMWMWIAVAGLVLILGPFGLVAVSYLALSRSISSVFMEGSRGASALLTCPVPGGIITQGFGPTSVVLEPPMFGYAHFHTGIDLAAPTGTSVLAATAGVVQSAGTMVDALGIPTGYGNYIKVTIGGQEQEIYGHLLSAAVSPGEAVRAGEPIGRVGTSGTSTGPHLHFEVRVGGVPVDPGALRC